MNESILLPAKERLLAAYRKEAAVTSPEAMRKKRAAFAEAFPLEALELRGRELLERVHGAKSTEGLFYQLEFGELGKGLGVVAGGAALKFRVYRAQTGEWKKKGPGGNPATCSEADAIHITEQLADQLRAGALWADELHLRVGDRKLWEEFAQRVNALPPVPGEVGQDQPTLTLGWAHKYLAILHPYTFSFHHRAMQLSRHLVRLGILPEADRYLLDWQWQELLRTDPDLADLDPVTLMWAAYDDEGFGYGVDYWRLGTVFAPEGVGESLWPEMRDGGFASIGWGKIGDLRVRLAGEAGVSAEERIEEALKSYDYGRQGLQTRAAQINQFFAGMKPGDRIIAMQGQKLQGIGIVEGDYEYVHGKQTAHRRPVRWLAEPDVVWSEYPGRLRTVYRFTDRYPQAVFIERQVVEAGDTRLRRVTPEPRPPRTVSPRPLHGRDALTHAVLERKGQVILYGPPGTGKTYHAWGAAREIVTRDLFPEAEWAGLDKTQQQEVQSRITACTFHPAYTYEEFIEGYRPVLTDTGPSFERQEGLFIQACEQARREPEVHHVLIVDEINRGNVAAVLGELITLLEADKRETHAVRLPLSRREFSVPKNLWIIGTMNTADRSISLLDAALRRRFGFIELLPEPGRLDARIQELHLGNLLSVLNRRVRRHVPRNARELQVGHAYFLSGGRPLATKRELLEVMRDDVFPLLAEYCFESYGTLKELLGEGIVDTEAQRFRRDVLGGEEALYTALLALLSTEPTAQDGAVLEINTEDLGLVPEQDPDDELDLDDPDAGSEG